MYFGEISEFSVDIYVKLQVKFIY